VLAERGLPIANGSDKGVPFASPNALFNLSKLSVWWLRLGIQVGILVLGQVAESWWMHRQPFLPPGIAYGNGRAACLRQNCGSILACRSSKLDPRQCVKAECSSKIDHSFRGKKD
jgi:hypothetical protein